MERLGARRILCFHCRVWIARLSTRSWHQDHNDGKRYRGAGAVFREYRQLRETAEKAIQLIQHARALINHARAAYLEAWNESH
jgi:hypothetical protein